jgi:glycolate oxidase FAD binding subunit
MSAGTVASFSRLESLVGSSAFIAAPDKVAAYAIDGIAPSVALQPASAEEVAEIVKFAVGEKLSIIPSGARTKTRIGLSPARYDIALDMTRMNRIVACDPGDLTLSVEPGLFLRDLHRELGKHGHTLPLGAPFMTHATIGGTIASGVDGPMRQLYGTARDFVLGMEFVTGDGAIGKSGGRVVKNVTGYDLHKLMIGSLGTLGILTKINFRTFPAPQLLRGFVAQFSSAQDAAALRDSLAASPLRPLTFEIFSPSTADLFARQQSSQPDPLTWPGGIFSAQAWNTAISFSGNEAVLDRCESDLRKLAEGAGATHFTRIGAEPTSKEMLHVGAVFTHVREFVPIALESSPAATVLKISVLPEHLEHALCAAKHAADDHSLPWAAMARSAGIIYMALLPAAGASGDHIKSSIATAAHRIQTDIARLNGHATIPWCPAEWKSALKIWGPDREDLPLMRKVKSVFDPHGIFAPGRFVGGI